MAGNLKAILAECIGTFALVFLGAGSLCVDALTGGKLGPTAVALTHGLALTAMSHLYGRVSGGHFNPALTVAMLLFRRIDRVKGIFYIAAQLMGAVFAGLGLQAVLHNYPSLWTSPPYLGACDLAAGIGYKAGTLLEAIGAFFLASIWFASSQPRGQGPLAPLYIGLTWTACILAMGPLTGAALNPARAFGPAVVTGYWTNGFVYWIGPLAGAFLASWLYETLYLEKKK